MPDPLDIIKSAQIFLLFGFLGLTSLRFVLALLNRSSVREVAMTFPSRRFWGIRPIHLAVFFVAAGLVVSAVIRQNEVPVVLYSGYLLGAVLWLAGSMIASRVVVTRYGILRGMTGNSNRIAWAQVNDGFDVERRGGRAFVFLYTDDRMYQRRFEVFVPNGKVDGFARVIQQHLTSADDAQLFPAVGRRAVED